MAVDFKDYMNRPLTMTTAEKFISNFKRYSIFSEEALKNAISGFRIKDFATTHYCPVENSAYYEKRYPRYTAKPVSHLYKEYKAEWEREVHKLSYAYIVPDNYQLKEKDVFEKALFYTNPELRVLDWSIYHFDREDSDIYLKTSSGSVYCPIIALVKNDINAIIKRHTSYHKKYYSISQKARKILRPTSPLFSG